MMRRSPTAQASLVALAVVLSACTTPVQQAANAKPSPQPSSGVVNVPTSPSAPMPGGYTNQPVDTPLVQDEAKEAITLLRERTKDDTLSLTAVRTARTQVVAGMNIELTLDVATRNGPKTVTLVMYRSLQGDRSLTSVEGL